MHALVFDRFGEPEVLEWRVVPDPVPASGSALVQISVAGLNYADVYRRRGDYHMDATPPWILGYEGAGVIVALGGSNMSGFKVGDRVGFADSPRANAELAAVATSKLIALPDEISFETAAAVLLQGLTAQYLTSDSYTIRRGDVALVHAAAGGVGLLLTQMLAARGAEVVALASTVEKREAAIRVGARLGLSYEEDWNSPLESSFGRLADVVFESVGSTLERSMGALRTGGTVVFYGFAGGNPPSINPRQLMDRSLTITGGDLWNVLTGPKERRRRADELFQAILSGALKVEIAERVPMSEGARAHRLIESRGTIGKILLTV